MYENNKSSSVDSNLLMRETRLLGTQLPTGELKCQAWAFANMSSFSISACKGCLEGFIAQQIARDVAAMAKVVYCQEVENARKFPPKFSKERGVYYESALPEY